MSEIVSVRAAKRGMRWWIPVSIVALALARLVSLHTPEDLDGMFKTMQTAQAMGGSLVLLLVWWLFLNGLPWRTRLSGFGLIVLCVASAVLLVRIDGSAGTGQPVIVWRWTPKKSGEVGEIKVADASQAKPMIEGVQDYPGYLGGNRTGVVAGVQPNRDWAAHLPQQLWRRPVGLGWSAFAVSGNRAFTQEQRGEDELVVCYDLANGLPVWSHANHVRFSESMGGDGPRATPTVQEGRVYAMGATGILDCLDAAAGRLIWSRDTLKDNDLPKNVFGQCSSPLIVDDLVVVTGGQAKKSTLLGYRRAEGSPAWQAGRDEASFSSPALATLGGKRQILLINAASVTGHDPANGRILWEYSWANNKWPKCAQPVVLEGDRVLLSASFDAGCVLLQVKAAPDGVFSVTETWKKRSMKSEFSNLVTRDGCLYGLDDGMLACVDIATGERKWKDGRYGHGQLVLVDDLLLIQAEKGFVALVEASPAAYHEVARLDALKTKTWNTPAVAGELLLVRNDQEAACYRLPRRQVASPP